MQQFVDKLQTLAVEQLPGLIVPIAILVVGWLLAIVVSALVSRALRRTRLNHWITVNVLGREENKEVKTERWISKGTYYVIVLFTLLGFLQAINLTAATEPVNALLRGVFEFVPQLMGAGVVLLVGWASASVVRRLLSAALRRWELDRKVVDGAGETDPPSTRSLSDTTAQVAYWLVLLLFVPAALSALRLDGMLTPFRSLVEKVLSFVPNLGSAALILAAGWFVARVLQRLVVAAVDSAGSDSLWSRMGIGTEALGGRSLAVVVGNVVYGLTLIPVVIGALNALRLEAVTAPASRMLSQFFAAIPTVFGAAMIIAIAYAAGHLLRGVVTGVLASTGFDRVLFKIGIERDKLGQQSPSALVGSLVLVAVVYFAAMEAARLLGFEAVAVLASEVAVLVGRILLGLFVFGVGMFIAQVAATAVAASRATQAHLMAMVVRVCILTLAGAMALRQMGLANEIIVLAFGLVLGSVAVAAAIAFGLGGRDVAARTIEEARAHLHTTAHERAGAAPATAAHR